MMKDLPQPSENPTIEELKRVVDERQRLLLELDKELGAELEFSPAPIDPPPSEEGYLKHLIYLQKVDYHCLLKEQLKVAKPHERRLVILDLDHTLIYLYNPAKEKEVEFFARLNGTELPPRQPPEGISYQDCIFCKRPHLDRFIQQLKGWGLDLAIYSTATLPYIQAMLKLAQVDPILFVKIWHREHCARERGQALHKSVEWAVAEGYQQKNILVVDDVPNYRSFFPDGGGINNQKFNTLSIPSFQGDFDDALGVMLKRIEILKELDIIEQRRKEEIAWLAWRDEANKYKARVNKNGVFIQDEGGGLKLNPNYKRYPIHAPNPIDHFDEK